MFSCRKISCKLMKLLQRQSPSSPLWRLPRVERGYDMTWVKILPPGWFLLPSPPAACPASASGTSSIFGLDTRPANIVVKTQPGFIWNKNANPILRKQTYPLICWRCLLTITNIRTKSIASMKAETGSKEVWNNDIIFLSELEYACTSLSLVNTFLKDNARRKVLSDSIE